MYVTNKLVSYKFNKIPIIQIEVLPSSLKLPVEFFERVKHEESVKKHTASCHGVMC